MSARPSRSACSIDLTKAPSPQAVSAARRSPAVSTITSSDGTPAAPSASATRRACARASALPRVPIRMGVVIERAPSVDGPSAAGVAAALAQEPFDLRDELGAGRQASLVDHALQALDVEPGLFVERRRCVEAAA